ncbi:hypothetical protein YC2023_107454 [Brassica napus]
MPDGQDNKEARCVRVWDLGAEGGDREEAGGVMVLCETVREGLEEGRVEECVDSRLRANFLAEEAIPVIKQEECENIRAHTVSLIYIKVSILLISLHYYLLSVSFTFKMYTFQLIYRHS